MKTSETGYTLKIDQQVINHNHAFFRFTDYRWANYDAFVLNDWKVKSNLTLNLGLRYSLQFPRAAASDFQGVFLGSQAQTVTIPADQTLQLTSGNLRRCPADMIYLDKP